MTSNNNSKFNQELAVFDKVVAYYSRKLDKIISSPFSPICSSKIVSYVQEMFPERVDRITNQSKMGFDFEEKLLKYLAAKVDKNISIDTIHKNGYISEFWIDVV